MLLITPDGNWSSYPPHKHDEAGDGAINEEIYFFQIEKVPDMLVESCSRSSSSTTSFNSSGGLDVAAPYAFHRTFTADLSSINDTETVFPGDVYLVPRGYHGPCVTPPGYNLYYLNVLAGPNPERSMQFCWHVEQNWLVQNQWRNLGGDRRLPLCCAEVPGTREILDLMIVGGPLSSDAIGSTSPLQSSLVRSAVDFGRRSIELVDRKIPVIAVVTATEILSEQLKEHYAPVKPADHATGAEAVVDFVVDRIAEIFRRPGSCVMSEEGGGRTKNNVLACGLPRLAQHQRVWVLTQAAFIDITKFAAEVHSF
eukprot:g13283.t1